MGRLCMDLCLKQLIKRYIGADRVMEALILDEFCSNSGYKKFLYASSKKISFIKR